MDLKDIKAIIDLTRKNSISEFELEKEGFKIRLKRGPNGVSPVAYEESGMMPSPLALLPGMPATPPPAAAPVTVASTPDLDIKSPMIGTFYRAPSPDSASYIEVGSEVGPETVVCIIEAMKVMNEIKSEVKGIVTQVLVENAKPVEFGQPLFKVRPN